ncbi:prefoldin subunit 2 [Coturnix japonica]|uniref:prefoldin subunit 2 n=1 Tax=Coturnix japonica TaxID=93934 RepID=UPI0007779E58|nr:prefoldin subunit 2 [Coturnix japonica]
MAEQRERGGPEQRGRAGRRWTAEQEQRRPGVPTGGGAELELNEHGLVIETLREVDPTRKCYRMVGGILVERTVKEVLPALEGNREQISKIIESLSQQLQSKGRELNEFREKHNIRLVGEDDPRQPPKDGTEGGKGGTAGVLVS